jgi:ABC-type branched-subunit amino acid transport system substrate-binding protein/sugar lactone lactonase YvrE
VGDELRPGAAFAGLVVDALVASGGMGSIYRATDPTLRRTVALKVIAPVLAEDSRFRDRFLVEARLAASLEHPAIVPVYAAGEGGGRLYLAMRFMEGGSLADLLDASPALSLTDTVRLLGPVADALDAAHRAGLVHRDVKPGNILLQGDRAYVADFGLAVTEVPEDGLDDESSSGADLALSGTTAYLAPERIEGDHATGASDQYALGCVAFECLTGVKPFGRSNELAVVYAHLRESPPSAVVLRSELPSGVDAVLARALAKEPQDRFGSCREFVDALESTASSASTPLRVARGRRWRRGPRLAVVAAAGVAAAVVATTLVHGGSPAQPAAPGHLAAGDGVAVLDPAGGRQVSTISVGADPLAIASDGQRRVWVVNADDHTISRFDAVTTSATGAPFALAASTPSGLAYGEGALWVSAGSTADTLDFGTITNAVVRVDPVTDQQGDPIRLQPNTATVGFHHSGSQIAVGGGSVWVIDGAGSVERVDPTTGRAQVIPDDGYRASAVAFGDGAVWVLGEHAEAAGSPEGPFVWRIDPQTFHPSDPIRVQRSGASDLAVGAGSVWVASPWDGLVVRIHPGTQVRTETIPASGASAIRFDESGRTLWVADPLGHTLRAIDPATDRAGAPVELSGSPQGIAFAGGRAFASVINVGGGGLALRAAGVGDVQRPGCKGVWGDPQRRPDLLIVGDFPLDRVASRTDSEAVLSVLAEHGFRAGRHTVGYQVCDDRGSATNSVQDCAEFARAYAQTARVGAVITGHSSDCAQEQLPELLNAPGGAIAAVGTVSTVDALTDGSHPNYVRLVARDSDQVSAAIGEFARRRVSRVFLLFEDVGSHYISEVSDLFRRRATGPVTIVGADDYAPLDRGGIDRLARQVRGAGATGVYLVGLVESTTGLLLKALRAVSPNLVVVAPDSLNPVSAVIAAAGDAARGVYFTYTDPPNDLLPPTGRQWLHRFAATQLGAQVPTTSTLAAAAAQVLLDAVARSDGARGSVLAALRATNLSDSVIGPVRFTAHGDIRSCAVSVYQIVGGTFLVPDVQSDLQGATLVQRARCSPAAG